MSRYIWILAGGLSYEREVSLRSGRRIADALRRHGHDAQLRDSDSQLLSSLVSDPPEAVIIALHGSTGEDGALRALLEMTGTPYVGSDPDSSALAWNKPLAKARLAAAGIPTPASIALPHHTFRELGAQAVLDRVVDSLGLPLMVKPNQGGSGLGATAVRERADLSAAMVACFGYGDTVLIEQFVAGTDIAVSVIASDGEPTALDAVEIVPLRGVYDYEARYTTGNTTWHTPARLPEDVTKRVREIAVDSHKALGLRDLSRIDFIVDGEGTPWVLEANVAPGTTETSLLPQATEAAGIDFGELFSQLVETAIKRQPAKA